MSLYNQVPAYRYIGFIISLTTFHWAPPHYLSPASHFAFRCKKLFQLQSTFHKVIERISKGSINNLISIVMGSLPFRLLEIYEAISSERQWWGAGTWKEGRSRVKQKGRRRWSRKWHIGTGINGITLLITIHPEMMCTLLSGASLTPHSP